MLTSSNGYNITRPLTVVGEISIVDPKTNEVTNLLQQIQALATLLQPVPSSIHVGPHQTIKSLQDAITYIKTLSLTSAVTVQVEPGSYTGPVVIESLPFPHLVSFICDINDPSVCRIVSTTDGVVFKGKGGSVSFSGFHLVGGATGYGIHLADAQVNSDINSLIIEGFLWAVRAQWRASLIANRIRILSTGGGGIQMLQMSSISAENAVFNATTSVTAYPAIDVQTLSLLECQSCVVANFVTAIACSIDSTVQGPITTSGLTQGCVLKP